MAVSVDLAKALDKAYEDKLNIKTVRQFGASKHFAVAAALVAPENAG
jgi:hypothetical protein